VRKIANYYAVTRTNYFAVTDAAKFREIIGSCVTDEEAIQIFDPEGGSERFGFGCYGSIRGIPAGEGEDDSEEDIDAFHDALQSVLVDGDAIVITEIGYEKLRYLIGCCTVITKRDIRFLNLIDSAVGLARIMLENPEFTTKMNY
jgi:hypothetical protein